MSKQSLTDSVLSATPNYNVGEFDKHIKYFGEELEMISDPKIKSFVKSVMSKADPFWISPASLIEGAHPPDEYSPEGMIMHTKRVFRIVVLLMWTLDLSDTETDSIFTSTLADCVFAATLLHDITKAIFVDEESPIVDHDPMHPYTVDTFVKFCKLWDEENNIHPPQDNSLEIDAISLETILKLIRFSHGMFSPIPETIPTTPLENILHTADLLAANLHLIIDGPDVKAERWNV